VAENGERRLRRLEDIPYVGPSIAASLRVLEIHLPEDLVGRDPYALYHQLNADTGVRHDPCLLDTFISAVHYVEGGPRLPWWAFTAERKRVLAGTE
jgi:hypothetical protein